MMKKVTVYSTSTCPYCVMLKRWFKENNIDYTEYLVDRNPIAAQQMVQLSKQMGVPFTTVEEDDQMTKIVGYDVAKLQTIFG